MSSSTEEYINEEKDGAWIRWRLNGQIRSKWYYRNGEEVGIWVWYYENGEKEAEGDFSYYLKPESMDSIVQDLNARNREEEKKEFSSITTMVYWKPRHGLWKFWDKNGVLTKEYYKMGVLISKEGSE
ncbi:MAG: hypothetical protein AB8F95_04180 [Bacteroidia bacterium]